MQGERVTPTTTPGNGAAVNQRWLARLSLVLMLAAAAVLVGFAGLRSLALVGIGVLGVCVALAGGYWFLANRGVLRWGARGVVMLTPNPKTEL